MARYSIDGQILTDIGDAIRARIGTPEPELLETLVSSTPGATLEAASTEKPEGVSVASWTFNTYTIEGADKITLDMKYKFLRANGGILFIASGVHTTEPENPEWICKKNHPNTVGDNSVPSAWNKTYSIILEGTDTFTIGYYVPNNTTYTTWPQYYATIRGFNIPGIKPEEMADEINGLPAAPSAEDLVITGDCQYKFAQGGWNWVIEKYGDLITTNNITRTDYMFVSCPKVDIPFAINCNPLTTQSWGSSAMDHMFQYFGGTEIPMIHTPKPSELTAFTYSAYYIREFPEGFGEDWNWSHMTGQTSGYSCNKSGMFENCYSLRKLPMGLLQYGNPYSINSYNQLNTMCKNCYSLDEIVDLPNPHTEAVWSESSTYSQALKEMVDYCARLKNFTFAEMGPMKWAVQTLDLTKVGYVTSSIDENKIIGYNSGITADKKVTDDATYQALKDDPDWYTLDANYSRYNHDSAVATINSLPDCSAYQTESGKGANILALKSSSGTNTDGGAIGNLTEDEIAVAAAKGWTVSLRM